MERIELLKLAAGISAVCFLVFLKMGFSILHRLSKELKRRELASWEKVFICDGSGNADPVPQVIAGLKRIMVGLFLAMAMIIQGFAAPLWAISHIDIFQFWAFALGSLLGWFIGLLSMVFENHLASSLLNEKSR